MSTILKTRIIKVGNSQGIRIPKLLLDRVGLESQVEVEAQPHQLVIRPVSGPSRRGWAAQFKAMAEEGDDRLLDAETTLLTRWETTEWVW